MTRSISSRDSMLIVDIAAMVELVILDTDDAADVVEVNSEMVVALFTESLLLPPITVALLLLLLLPFPLLLLLLLFG